MQAFSTQCVVLKLIEKLPNRKNHIALTCRFDMDIARRIVVVILAVILRFHFW